MCIPLDQYSCPDKTVIGHDYVVDDRGVYPQEAILSYVAESGDDDMRCNKAVVPDDGSVSHMIAAPEDDIVTDLYKGLYGIILKDETVLPLTV